MAKLTKFEKEVMAAEHKYFKVKTDLYGYKIMLKSSAVKKFMKRSEEDKYLLLHRLPINDYLMVKYRIPKGADIYVSGSGFGSSSWCKKCRASEVEIVEIREIIEEENGEIHTGKQYNGYAYSTHIVMASYGHNKNIISVCSKPSTYGRCKKGQKFLMKNFFHLTIEEIDKELSENTPSWYRAVYNTYPKDVRVIRCKRKATCNRGFHFFMEEAEAFNYLVYGILLRV